MLKKTVNHIMNLKKIIELILTFVTSSFQCLRTKKPQHHFLSYKNDGFYLDGIKIIDQKVTLQIAFLKILVEHSMNEFFHTSSYIRSSKILGVLRKLRLNIENNPNQICDIAYNVRKTVKRKTGIKIEIIDSENWNGYRLSDHIILLRNPINPRIFSEYTRIFED